jgi:hypothetical protein
MKLSQNSLFKADTYLRSVAESRILGLVHVHLGQALANSPGQLYESVPEYRSK